MLTCDTVYYVRTVAWLADGCIVLVGVNGANNRDWKCVLHPSSLGCGVPNASGIHNIKKVNPSFIHLIHDFLCASLHCIAV